MLGPDCGQGYYFSVGNYFRLHGHKLSIIGADKKAIYRAKYIFLEVGGRGLIYMCVLVYVCLKKDLYFPGSRT